MGRKSASYVRHKRKSERKATSLNYKLNEEVNVNPDTSPYPSARICPVSVQMSDLQGLSEEFIVFKRVFFIPLAHCLSTLHGQGWCCWRFQAVLMAVLLRNALQISQQGTFFMLSEYQEALNSWQPAPFHFAAHFAFVYNNVGFFIFM